MDTTMTQLAELYQIDNFIDTFALGHYARVLGATLQQDGRQVAFKLLRPEHLVAGEELRWEYRAFANEAQLLARLDANPHVVQLIDCGYVAASGESPTQGDITPFGRDVEGFSQAQRAYAARGWRPYLALEYLPRTYNLYYAMRPDRAGVRSRLPSEEGLALALQFAELLKMAHQQRIAYLDHKLEHLYWDGTHLKIIDLNSSRFVDNNGREAERYLQMDIHNLCVGILYSVFTGLSPQKASLRPQPGSITDVETRYQDITTLDFGVEPALSIALQRLLQRGAAMQIETIDEFITDLREVAALHGWDFPERYTNAASREARAQMRAGLSHLREGEDAIRQARDLFREAAIQDGLSEDIEAELRRLLKAVNEMLNYRPIP
jgi:serine/threonine protein kinase